ncbi:MAG: PQQ-binding-like beta-propeller repeat protein [Candidatus Bathyarchaeia archaeon]
MNESEDDCPSISVFYYVGESKREISDGKTSFFMDLDKPLFDWEIDDLLPSNQSKKSTLIILDTQYGGGYVSKLQKPGRVILCACNPVEKIFVGLFTGHENARYANGTCFGPLGIIGAMHAAEDINKDGWLSADEVFRFSWKTLVEFTLSQQDTSVPHPWGCYGVVGGALPIIQLDETKSFIGEVRHCSPTVFLPNSSRYNWGRMECHTYRYSLTRVGCAQSEGVGTPDVLWSMYLNSSVVSSPIVADGIIYIATLSGKIYALDFKTGEEFWTLDTNCTISSTPSFNSGMIIFGTERPGRIYALDACTGALRWLYEIPEGGVVQCSPAIVDGKVIIGSSDGYLRCFSQFDGELLWESYVGGKPSSPAISNQTVFTTCPYISAVNITNGALIWRYVTNWPVFSAPAVADGLVFIGAENDDKVFTLDQRTGEHVWSHKTGGWLTSPAVDSSKKLVIAGCRDARTYCLSEFTGYLKWQYISAPNHLSAPTISEDGLVYFGSTDGYVYCLNEETGREIWKYDVGSPIVSSPVVACQHLIVASEEGKLLCFGLKFPEHNIAILYANISSHTIREGSRLNLNFTVKNYGDTEENIKVTIYIGSPYAMDQFTKFDSNITLSPKEGTNCTLYTDSLNVSPGFYSVLIETGLVPDETDYSDNVYSVGTILVLALADVDANGEVNIIDISRVAFSYDSKVGDPNWNPDADINKDNIVNIIDISMVAKEFGKIYPYAAMRP